MKKKSAKIALLSGLCHVHEKLNIRLMWIVISFYQTIYTTFMNIDKVSFINHQVM